VTAPKRRWSFTLRTLFAAVTICGVFAGWLGHEASTVRHRMEMRDYLIRRGANIGVPSVHGSPFRSALSPPKLPRLRAWFGDDLTWLIWLNGPLTAADEQAIAAFPEANVYVEYTKLD
jgi:hypothetical protein